MKYRKKPIVIEAVKYERDHIGRMQDFCDKLRYNPHDNEYYIDTLEGCMKASDGDFIIKGVNGEFYPCKADIFEKTYDLVTEKDNEKAYIIEFDNGEPYEDGWSYPLNVVFESLDNAIDYIKSTYIEVDPEDYYEEVRKKLPTRRYYTKESVNYNGQHEFRLEDDKFEKFAHYIYDGHSFYTIHEVTVVSGERS